MHNCGLQFIMYPSNDNSDAGLRDFWLFHVGKVGYMAVLGYGVV